MIKNIDPSCDSDIVDSRELGTRVHKMLSEIEERTPEEREEALKNRIRALSSLGGVAELNSVEGDYMFLNIYRDNPVLEFCEMRDLPLGSLPFFRTRYTTPTQFTVGSVNAMGSSVYWATNDAATQVFPFTITSDEITIPNLNAIYDMVRLEQRLEGLKRLSRDMKIGLVNCALNTLFTNPSSGNVVTDDPAVQLVNYFSNGGAFAGQNVYVLDPGVVAAGVPTTNVYDLSATEVGLTKLVFQTINNYSIQFGLGVRKIYVPNAPTSGNPPVWEGLQNAASIVAISSGNGNQNPSKAVPDAMWSQFQRDDYRSVVTLDWFGLNVDIERQNWLPAGYILVLMDQPGVIIWDRLDLATGEDRAGTLEVPINGYMTRRSEAKQIATARPGYTLKNWILIKVQ